MTAILIRHNKYLNERHQWGNLPHLFPDWQLPAVMGIMMHEGNAHKPTGWAMVEDEQVIDLDTLEVMEIK